MRYWKAILCILLSIPLLKLLKTLNRRVTSLKTRFSTTSLKFEKIEICSIRSESYWSTAMSFPFQASWQPLLPIPDTKQKCQNPITNESLLQTSKKTSSNCLLCIYCGIKGHILNIYLDIHTHTFMYVYFYTHMKGCIPIIV